MRPVDLVVLSRPCGPSRLSAFRLWSMAFSWQIMSCFLLLVYYLNKHPGIISLDLQGLCVLSHLFPSFYKYACWHLGRVTGSPDHTCPLWRHQGWSAQFWLTFRGFPQCHTMLFLLEKWVFLRIITARDLNVTLQLAHNWNTVCSLRKIINESRLSLFTK